LNVDPTTGQLWQDFKSQLDRAGASIETTFITGLEPLIPGLTNLSAAVKEAVNIFLHSDTVKNSIDALAPAIENFARYLAGEKFQSDVRDIVDAVGALASGASKIAKFFGGDTYDDYYNREHKTLPGSKFQIDDPGLRARLGGAGGSTMDALLGMVRGLEGSGDTQVSPKG